MTIWKFPVPVADSFAVNMPVGARLLSVQVQHGEPVMWALVDPAASMELRRFHVYGTGHPVGSEAGEFVGTFQIHGGSLVFHLFTERA